MQSNTLSPGTTNILLHISQVPPALLCVPILAVITGYTSSIYYFLILLCWSFDLWPPHPCLIHWPLTLWWSHFHGPIPVVSSQASVAHPCVKGFGDNRALIFVRCYDVGCLECGTANCSETRTISCTFTCWWSWHAAHKLCKRSATFLTRSSYSLSRDLSHHHKISTMLSTECIIMVLSLKGWQCVLLSSDPLVGNRGLGYKVRLCGSGAFTPLCSFAPPPPLEKCLPSVL